jgi:GxxExxY protein
MLSPEVERLATTVVDSAFKVHKTLGAGLLESVYKVCLLYELRLRGLSVETQVAIPVRYE